MIRTMARKRTVPLPDGTQGEAEVVGFRPNVEHWNEYLLDDGSAMKIKVVVTEVMRVEGQYDQRGDPVYIVQSTNVIAVDAAEGLRREGGAG